MAFALEKALISAKEFQRHSTLCFFGPESDYIAAFAELNWLRLLAHAPATGNETVQLAQEFISFQ